MPIFTEPDLAQVTAKAEEYIVATLGVPASLAASTLAVDGSVLQYPARTLRKTVMLRLRLLGRTAVAAQQLESHAHAHAHTAAAGRQPLALSPEELTRLVELETRVRQLDDVLVDLAGDLIEGGVQMGLIERPGTWQGGR